MFSRLYGSKSRVCSDSCEQAAARVLKRREKSARRAAERSGRAAYGAFDPFDVFERDGWICNQCGVLTPVGLRGTTHADAPELDHIQPLSKGGIHSKENAQLLCRACNIDKADKWDGW
ncbi:HNH endonuclease [Vreelandella venusta]|nr:HNH endonuclease [Halomonas venusta]